MDFLIQVLQALTEGAVPSDVPESSDSQIPSASGASGNDHHTPESSPRPVGSGAPSPISEGSTEQDSQDVPVNDAETAETHSWFRRQFRNVLRDDGLSVPSSLASTPNSSLQATPVQPMPESTEGPSTPGPKTPELLRRSVKRLFEDTKK